MSYSAIIKTPCVTLGIRCDKKFLTHIEFLPKETALQPSENSFAQGIINQINAYFKNPNYSFTIPTKLKVTEFQKQVLNALKNIPAGTTQTYGELAKQLNTSPRAVGQACRRNPIPIIIPCHRVISQQNIGGYSGAKKGDLLNIKKYLLKLENLDFR